MDIGLPPPRDVPVVRRPPGARRAGLLAVLYAALTGGGLLAAPDTVARGPATQPEAAAPITHPLAGEERRAALRHALTHHEPDYPSALEPRRLSPEERNALNRELRALMRGLYEQQAVQAQGGTPSGR